jgi:hypothetical protein
LRRWLREPLLHFVLLGAAFFAADALVSDRSVEAAEEHIVVTPGRIENLAALHFKTWKRPPTPEELQGLVDDFVLEEALYREGLALGLDRDDAVIRRRLRQKLEFIADELIDLVEPTEADLGAWLAEHPDSYTPPTSLSFLQVYLSPQRRGDALAADAEQLLARLRGGDVDPESAGDHTLLDHAFLNAEADVVARTFDQAFADRLAEEPLGEWSGPVESPFGLHLVRIDSRVEGSLPVLAEVRDEVERDWLYARRDEAEERFHREILERYRVSIEWPMGAAATRE